MNTVNTLNIYLNGKRKYLLIALNVVLSIFIIFQVAILNSIRPDIGDIQALPPTNTDSSHGSDSDTKNPNREGKGYK
ncbi:MAG: hypothetical protein CL764_04205 [Chloroflexi bacterium]|nr:hypothetical protein [Chloroflexota bacterium]|tara:strand:- start:853 stop:1083 length:231 start_codon:yes stop_codon:yes gene_type:complete